MPTEHLTTLAIVKNASYAVVFASALQYVGINPESIGIYATLMFIDIVTGIVRTGIIKGWRSVTSKELTFGVIKKALALTSIFTVGLAGKGVGFDMSATVQGFVNVAILGETYSVLGNIYSARTRSVKVEFDAVSWAIGRIRTLLDKIISTR